MFNYNSSPLNQAYQPEGDSIDVHRQGKLTPWLNASGKVQNLRNEWRGQYVGVPGRVTIAVLFG